MRNESEIYNIYQTLHRAFGPQHWWPGDSEFEMMTGAILTQNSAWTNVEKALKNLKEHNLLSLGKLLKTGISDLARLIRPAGYFNLKARRLKALVLWLQETCKGRISQLRKINTDLLRNKLLGVYGIGPETADSILVYALKKKSFVIDAYTKRIFSRHGFLRENDSYDYFKKLFETALPKKLKIYNEYHALIVKLGKDFCRKTPKCSQCPLEEDLKNCKDNFKFRNKDGVLAYA